MSFVIVGLYYQMSVRLHLVVLVFQTPSFPFFFFAHCVILFVCLLSICNSYNYYMYMFRRPALMVYSFWWPSTTLLQFAIIVFIVVNKIYIYHSASRGPSAVAELLAKCAA